MLKERLIYLRKKCGLSQYELAEKLGFSRGKLANYEQGSRQPDYDTLIQIAEFFDVSTDYLLKGDDFKKQAQEILDNPDTHIAARDGNVNAEKTLKLIEEILREQNKGK